MLVASLAAGCAPQPSVVPTKVADSTAKEAGEPVDHPEYVNWCQFAVGTTVCKKKEVSNDVGTVHVETVLRLKEKTDTKVVVESQVSVQRPGEPLQENPPMLMDFPAKFRLPSGMRLEQFRLPSLKARRTGGESVKIESVEYQAETFEWQEVNEAGPMTVKIWRSDMVPGRLLRQDTFVKQTKESSSETVANVKLPSEPE